MFGPLCRLQRPQHNARLPSVVVLARDDVVDDVPERGRVLRQTAILAEVARPPPDFAVQCLVHQISGGRIPLLQRCAGACLEQSEQVIDVEIIVELCTLRLAQASVLGLRGENLVAGVVRWREGQIEQVSRQFLRQPAVAWVNHALEDFETARHLSYYTI
jgi:hypothetical protein